MVHRSPLLTVLEEAADAHPQNLAFKVPILEGERLIRGWRDISYLQTYEKVDTVARYWLKTLKLPPGSVVGLWMAGLTFSDMLHIFGIMRADYVPHLLNSAITNAEVAASFFQETNCGVIIYASQASNSVKNLPEHFVCHPIIDAEEIPENSDVILSYSKSAFDNEEVVMILLTSGSVSGSPKLIRLRRRWFEANSRKRIVQKQKFVIPRVGSFCHASQFYTPLLSANIRHAHQNPELLSTLQAFPAVFFIGSALSKVDMEWCKNNNITLRSAFSATETGGLMVSGEDPSIFRLIKADGCSYGMVPVNSDLDTSPQSPLLELVVFSNSLDCPDRSFCDPIDGNFHTKDLFEEIRPGEYQYRGRWDDIIKLINATKCDTKYIEERVYTLCGDLISTCVVVGSEKPSPALVVEPTSTNINETELIWQLNDRLTSINEGGYPNERITPNHILVVSPGELPRTSIVQFKRNVIRALTEIKFRSQIDALFA
ncbi:hypothetical protein Clacol_008918 [Clathrus columnatus]|uniref:AMP-dependent synthetase/ligase domain-containing protein n=1 Tax=Clathrus columnatus TaxID=1419009 RepID=A0AAV5ALU0_9AGAM|nr:hypothetical protein Clacol_008918 [Clathrus columnatus]